MLARLQNEGEAIVLSIYTESRFLPEAQSHNVMGEISGRELPNEIIAVGGHSDSWDNTVGAHDDASGLVAGWQIVKVLHDLNLHPRRTIRSVIWVNEENGNRGGIEYARAHKGEKHTFACEFDGGIFAPYSINFSGPDSIYNSKLKPLEPLLNSLFGSIEVTKGGGGVDIGPLMRSGVPGLSPGWDKTGMYFWYHHSMNDTPEKINSTDFNNQIAVMAIAMYILADMPD
jgi:carboxypeptidase Q